MATMIFRYKTQITSASYLWGILMLAFTIVLTYSSLLEGRFFGATLLLCISIAVWYFTFLFPTYQIDGEKLRVNTISGKVQVDISTIKKIESSTDLWGLGIFKPIQKGLRIHYGTYEDVFVNPANQEDFINQLTQVNPHIEVMLKEN